MLSKGEFERLAKRGIEAIRGGMSDVDKPHVHYFLLAVDARTGVCGTVSHGDEDYCVRVLLQHLGVKLIEEQQ